MSISLFAALFFVAYIGAAPVVLGRSDDAYDYIGRCFKGVLALVPLVILAAWFPRAYSYLGTLPYLMRPAIQYTGVALCLLSLLWTVIAQARRAAHGALALTGSGKQTWCEADCSAYRATLFSWR